MDDGLGMMTRSGGEEAKSPPVRSHWSSHQLFVSVSTLAESIGVMREEYPHNRASAYDTRRSLCTRAAHCVCPVDL